MKDFLRIKTFDRQLARRARMASDLLSFSFDKLDLRLAALAGFIAAVVLAFASAPILTGILPGAFFGAGVFMLFRIYLPLVLYIRVADFLRYRLAFLALCFAGTLGIFAAPAFVTAFASSPTISFCGLFALACLLLASLVGDRRYGILLAIAFLICGALVSIHPIGLMTLMGLVLVIMTFRWECATIDNLMGSDVSYGLPYIVSVRQVILNVRNVRFSLIGRSLMFLIGLALGAIIGKLAYGHAQVSVVPEAYRGFLIAFLTPGMLLLVACTGLLAGLAIVRTRRSTDVMQPAYPAQTVLSGVLVLLALAWLAGGALTGSPLVPVLASIPRTTSLLPDALMATVLVVANSYFIVECCCREDASLYAEDDLGWGRPTRRARQLRAFGIAAFQVLVTLWAL